MRIKSGILWVFIASLLLLLGWTNQVKANESDYTVRAMLAENQNPAISSYFDVTVAPGEKQTFTIVITNNTTEEKEYKIEPGTAVTNSNGVIDYSLKKAKIDSTLLNSFEELTSDAQTVKLAGSEKNRLILYLRFPKKALRVCYLVALLLPLLKRKRVTNPL